ncbi:MAG: hypothetical protein HWE22_02905 [Flavobacteriales bacterium]|nr:hypothetical protein [Flavobacteriales bacterium]
MPSVQLIEDPKVRAACSPLDTLQQEVTKAYFALREDKEVMVEGSGSTVIDHKTTSGQTLSKIAAQYGVELKDVKRTKSTKYLQIGEIVKVTKPGKKGKEAKFTKIKEATTNSEVYIIVETKHLQDEKALINIKQGKEDLFEKKNSAITVQVDDKEVVKIETVVGAFSKEEDITNKKDFEDWAIVKVKLAPKDEEKQKKWSENLEKTEGKKASLYLLVDVHSEHSMCDFESKYVDYKGYVGEGDDSKIRNHFLNEKDAWFEVKKGCGIELTAEMLGKIFPQSKEDRRKEVADAINKYKCEFEINNLDRMAHFLGQIGTETAQLNALYESYKYSAKTIYNIFLRKVLISHPTKSGKYTFKYHDLIEGYNATLECEYSNPTTKTQKNYGHKRDVENPIEVTKVGDKASWDYTEFSKTYSIKSEYIKSKKLFDYVYGCRMDNGDRSTSDGSDYFGVGFIHLTGKSKYKALDEKWKELYPNDKKDFMGDDISLLKTDVDVAMKASMIIWHHVQNGTNNKADKGNSDAAITSVTKDVNGGTNGLPERKKFTKKAYEILEEAKKNKAS